MRFYAGCIFAVVLIFLYACDRGQTNKEICDFQNVLCIEKIDNLEVMLDIEPKPLRTFRETEFIVTVTETDKIPDELLLDLTMPGMFMGKNQIVLRKTGKNKYAGKGVIPRCPSGKSLWQAEISIPEKGTVRFMVNVR